MIGRNVPLKRELIEQSSLLNLLMPHHDSVPSRRLNQRISSSATADFFNKIGHRQTSARLALLQATAVMDVAFGGTANDTDTVAKYLSIFFGAT
jgi:hypothetical protein